MHARRATGVVLLALVLFGCGNEADLDGGVAAADASSADAGSSDAAAEDAGAGDAGTTDASTADAGAGDAGTSDTSTGDASTGDASTGDSGTGDGGAADAGAGDAGPPDAGASDAGPPPVTCTEVGLSTETISDSASVGTPDTYFRDVRPGDPFCAEITGGGSGSWGVTVSNGTSSGIYCSDVPRCAITVPAGVTTLLVTALTSDIGYYTLTIRRVPP